MGPADTPDRARPRRLRRGLLVALASLAATLTLLAGAEAALRIAGVSVPRYAGLPPGGADYWVPCSTPGKPAGYKRAFPRRYRIHPEAEPVFAAQKPNNGFRVFALGESSVQGLPYEIGSFSDWLRLRMGKMMPDREVEVVNAGNPGWHATEIRVLLQESLGHAPDLLVWMVGHNEMVPQNVENLRRETESPVGAGWLAFARGLRLRHVLAEWIPSFGSWRVVVHARDGTDGRPCFGPELDLLKRRFREATEGAVRDAKKAGVPIVLCTLPRNVRTNAPARSYFSPEVLDDPKRLAEYRRLLDMGKKALEAERDAKKSLECLRRAEKIDGHPAELHFAMGRALDAAGDPDGARAEFAKALELDGCPMRAQEWVESTIREVAAAEGAPIADLQAFFDARGKLGIAGEEFISDNVHPTLAGHELIAGELMTVFETRLGIRLDRTRDVSVEEGRAILKTDVYSTIEALKGECLGNLRLVLESGRADENWKKTVASCRKILDYNPSDWEIRGALGLLSTLGGDPKIGKTLIEEAMSKDEYVRMSYVLYSKTQAPFQVLLRRAGVDIAKQEAAMTAGQKQQLNNQLKRCARG